MEFIKTHWVTLVSGLVALIGLSVAIVFAMDDSVLREMQRREGMSNELESLRRSAQNERTIQAEKELAARFDLEYEGVLRKAEEINRRQPVMDGVFPGGERQRLDIPYRFRLAYQRAFFELPRDL